MIEFALILVLAVLLLTLLGILVWRADVGRLVLWALTGIVVMLVAAAGSLVVLFALSMNALRTSSFGQAPSSSA